MDQVKKIAVAMLPIAIGVAVGATIANVVWKKWLDKKVTV